MVHTYVYGKHMLFDGTYICIYMVKCKKTSWSQELIVNLRLLVMTENGLGVTWAAPLFPHKPLNFEPESVQVNVIAVCSQLPTISDKTYQPSSFGFPKCNYKMLQTRAVSKYLLSITSRHKGLVTLQPSSCHHMQKLAVANEIHTFCRLYPLSWSSNYVTNVLVDVSILLLNCAVR